MNFSANVLVALRKIDQLADDQLKSTLTAPEESILHSGAKKWLILASEQSLKDQTRDLEYISENQKFIDSDNLQSTLSIHAPDSSVGVPLQLKKFSPLQLSIYTQHEEALLQNQQLEALLSSYNHIIMLLSEKFAYWDQVLRQWENTVDTKIKHQLRH